MTNINTNGGGKFIKESLKKKGVYNFKYESISENQEKKYDRLKQKLKKEYLKIDFQNDKYAGVKLEAIYNDIISKEIKKNKKRKSETTDKNEIKEIKEYLSILKNRHPAEYETYNVKISNKMLSNIRKTKTFFKKFI